jgi:hypothetical protein
MAEGGLDREIVDKFLMTIREGDDEGFRIILDRFPALASARDPGGVSALMLALYHHREEMARVMGRMKEPDIWEAAATGAEAKLRELLAENPTRANEPAPDGFSPLGFAAFFGHEACARILVGFGADIDAGARNPAKVTPLHSAIAGGHHGVVRFLIERGAQVNARQQLGFTPLHGAAVTGDLDTVLVLLTAGADPSLTSDDGKTPIDLAIGKGHHQIASILEKKTRL